MAKFDIVKSIEVTYGIITILTTLPPRELGLTQPEIIECLFEALEKWVEDNGTQVRGNEVRFSGPIMAAAAGAAAGAFFYDLGASRVVVEDTSRKDPAHPEQKFWTEMLGKTRKPWSIRQGQIVQAQIGGTELTDIVVRSASLGDQYQVCGFNNREQVWIGRSEVTRFVRWLTNDEEQKFSEQPRYGRSHSKVAVQNRDRVRAIVLGIEVTGRVTAIRDTSCNVAIDNSTQLASLVPLDQIKEVLK